MSTIVRLHPSFVSRNDHKQARREFSFLCQKNAEAFDRRYYRVQLYNRLFWGAMVGLFIIAFLLLLNLASANAAVVGKSPPPSIAPHNVGTAGFGDHKFPTEDQPVTTNIICGLTGLLCH